MLENIGERVENNPLKNTLNDLKKEIKKTTEKKEVKEVPVPDEVPKITNFINKKLNGKSGTFKEGGFTFSMKLPDLDMMGGSKYTTIYFPDGRQVEIREWASPGSPSISIDGKEWWNGERGLIYKGLSLRFSLNAIMEIVKGPNEKTLWEKQSEAITKNVQKAVEQQKERIEVMKKNALTNLEHARPEQIFDEGDGKIFWAVREEWDNLPDRTRQIFTNKAKTYLQKHFDNNNNYEKVPDVLTFKKGTDKQRGKVLKTNIGGKEYNLYFGE